MLSAKSNTSPNTIAVILKHLQISNWRSVSKIVSNFIEQKQIVKYKIKIIVF